jgi:hypothetical protein
METEQTTVDAENVSTEATEDTPVIDFPKKAVSQPQIHLYCSLTAGSSHVRSPRPRAINALDTHCAIAN